LRATKWRGNPSKTLNHSTYVYNRKFTFSVIASDAVAWQSIFLLIQTTQPHKIHSLTSLRGALATWQSIIANKVSNEITRSVPFQSFELQIASFFILTNQIKAI
jgi:hypothetical protein